MCTLFFSCQTHPEYPFIFIGNRDEFYKRPAQSMHLWDDSHKIFAGKDLQAGGTWLGASGNGRFAVVTNFRDMENIRKDARSRGNLVTGFLESADTIAWLNAINQNKIAYNGFNFIAFDGTKLYYISSELEGFSLVEPGIYGLSNHLLDTPWFKVETGKTAFADIIRAAEPDREALFQLMTSQQKAPDNRLPQTGLSKKMEQLLSSIFIQSEDYGTRCSTLVLQDKRKNMYLEERTYDQQPYITKQFTLGNS